MRRSWPLIGVLIATSSCAEPAAIADAPQSVLVLQFDGSARDLVAAVDVDVTYRRTVGANQPLFETRLELDSRPQISMTIEIATCIADPGHLGSSNDCVVDVTVTLLDADDAPLDQQVIGPLTLHVRTTTMAPPVMLRDRRVALVVVTPASASIARGGAVQLTAELRDAEGIVLIDRPVQWSSSNTAVATVDANGTVTGVTPGSATITARSGEITGSAAITVTVDVASVVITPGSSTTTVGGTVQLTAQARAPDGSPVAGKSFVWTSSNGAIASVDSTGRVTGAALGSATITAATEGVSGTATINVVAPPPAGSLACGAVINASISAAGETDILTFGGVSGQTVVLTLVQTGGFAFNVGARATILAPGGAQIDVFNSNTQRTLTLAATGTFTVRITATNLTSTGTYNIGLECTCAPQAVDGTIAPGGLYSGALSQSAEVDLLTFAGQAGESVLLTLVQTGGFAFNVGARIRVLTPGCQDLVAFNSNSQQRIVLPESGTYVFALFATNLFHGGTYNVSLERLRPLGPIDRTIDPGDLVVAGLNTSAEVDVYTFTGQSGNRVLLTLTQTGGFAFNVGARATVLAPSGAQIDAFNSNTQRSLTLTETGTFTIYVNATNLFHAGTYNLGLERLQPLGPIDRTVVPGDLVAARLNGSAEVDIYTFTGQSGDRVLLTLVQTGGFAFNVGARATVIAPSGAQIDAFNSNTQRTLALTESGTFLIYVNATNLFHAGTYNVGFERLRPLGPVDGSLVAGSLISGSLTASAEVDVYTFAGQSGSQVLLTLVQTGGFAFNVGARATVIAPSGAQIDAFNSNQQRTLTLTETGTFIVYVNATNLFHSGTYNLGRQ